MKKYLLILVLFFSCAKEKKTCYDCLVYCNPPASEYRMICSDEPPNTFHFEDTDGSACGFQCTER